MIRTVKHKNGEYFIVNSFLEVKEKGKIIKVPLSVQVDSTRLSIEESEVVYRATHSFFNRTLFLSLDKPVKNEKSWWKKLFNK